MRTINQRIRFLKRWILSGLILGMAMVLMACGGKDDEQILKLITDFTEAAKNKNNNEIIPYYAIDSYASGYDMEIAKENFGEMAMQPTIEDRLDKASREYTTFLIGFSDEATSDVNSLSVEYINEIAKEINLEGLTINRIDIPKEARINSKSFQSILENQSKRYGAQSIAYRTVLYELDGDTYYCGFTLYKYNGKWEIADLSCRILPVHVYVVTAPLSEEEYLAMIEDDK